MNFIQLFFFLVHVDLSFCCLILFFLLQASRYEYIIETYLMNLRPWVCMYADVSVCGQEIRVAADQARTDAREITGSQKKRRETFHRYCQRRWQRKAECGLADGARSRCVGACTREQEEGIIIITTTTD